MKTFSPLDAISESGESLSDPRRPVFRRYCNDQNARIGYKSCTPQVLVNTIGHCAGAIAFGILLYLLLLDWRRATAERSLLPSVAAGLAFLWNIGSLIGMATARNGGRSRR